MQDLKKELSGGFYVVGFSNHRMKVPVYFPKDKWEREYPDAPGIKGYSTKALDIFIKFSSREDIELSDIRVEFVHLFTNEPVYPS